MKKRMMITHKNHLMKKAGSIALSTCLLINAGSISASAEGTDTTEAGNEEYTQMISNMLEMIDMTKWQYNAADDVYYQVGIVYCANPADTTYESMGIFIPGTYMTGTDNGDGTYTCTVNPEGTAGNYTAETAPYVIPVNTPGYSACTAPTGYSNVSEYTNAGFIYVYAGCRGRDQGAPTGVTDLKAAIRYTRYNADQLPGDTDRFFSFGMSGGGAQSALLGATGDSDLYDPYLEAIGAVMECSDALTGSMCWCPITSLDTADEAYEWNMGVTRTGLSEEEQAISDELAAAYAEYINQAGLIDSEGTVLTLEASEEGIYQAGSYYEYIKDVIETSLENFLEDTQFPYDASSSASGGRGGFGGPEGMREGDVGEKHEGGMPEGGPGSMPEGMPEGGPGSMPEGMSEGGPEGMPEGMSEGELPDGGFEEGNGMPEGMAEGNLPDGSSEEQDDMPEGTTEDNVQQAIEDVDNITRNQTSGGLSLSGTYETAQDYIDALNADGEWVAYDESTGEVTITSVADFVTAFKQASKNLGAFDQLNGGQGENTLFGYADGSGAHFDQTLSDILTELGSEYAQDYAEDLAKTDALGTDIQTRLDMYSPLYYLLESEEGYESSEVAKYWRIRTGINQGDTALSTEVNLALALEQYEGVEDVDFETVWAQGHTEAERTGSSTANFITWVDDCLAEETQQ